MAPLIAYFARSRWFSLLCLAVLAGALALPPEGLPGPGCQFKEWTHLPCLGCGMTRSFIGMAHLDLLRAALYHPVGIPLFLLTLGAAVLLPAPRALRARVEAWVLARPRLMNWLSVGLLVVFSLYGFGRMLWGLEMLRTGRPLAW